MQEYFKKDIPPQQKLLIDNIFSYGYKIFETEDEAIKFELNLIKNH